MKINNNFVLKEIDNEYVLIPLGQEVMNVKGMLKINEVGATIFNCLKQGLTVDETIEKLTNEYAADSDVIKNDALEFVALLTKYGVYK